MGMYFDCPHCGATHQTPASLRNRMIVGEPGASVPCPDCRKPIPIEIVAGGYSAGGGFGGHGQLPAGQTGPASATAALVGGILAGILGGAFLHIGLWFIFGVDVAGWSIPLGGFRLPIIYLALCGFFSFVFIVEYKRNAGASS